MSPEPADKGHMLHRGSQDIFEIIRILVFFVKFPNLKTECGLIWIHFILITNQYEWFEA